MHSEGTLLKMRKRISSINTVGLLLHFDSHYKNLFLQSTESLFLLLCHHVSLFHPPPAACTPASKKDMFK